MEGRSHGTPPTAGAAPTRGPPSMILLGHWCAKDGQEARGCNMVDSPSIAWTSCWVRVYRVRIKSHARPERPGLGQGTPEQRDQFPPADGHALDRELWARENRGEGDAAPSHEATGSSLAVGRGLASDGCRRGPRRLRIREHVNAEEAAVSWRQNWRQNRRFWRQNSAELGTFQRHNSARKC